MYYVNTYVCVCVFVCYFRFDFVSLLSVIFIIFISPGHHAVLYYSFCILDIKICPKLPGLMSRSTGAVTYSTDNLL